MNEPVGIVFAGGRGTRLWPLSRASAPKQFQCVGTSEPLLTEAIQRMSQHCRPERILVSTCEQFRHLTLGCLGEVPTENLVIERSGKGSAGAMALAVLVAHERFGDGVLLCSPSDHVILDLDAFHRATSRLLHEAMADRDQMVLLGVEPTRADAGLGYIVGAATTSGGVVGAVSRFVEKPDAEVAASLLNTRGVLWNTATYAFATATAVAALEQTRPDLTRSVRAYIASDADVYDGPADPGHELDALREAGMSAQVIRGEFGWSDVGTWPLFENAKRPPRVVEVLSGGNAESVTLAGPDGRAVVVAGVDNVVVISHKDATYIISRDLMQDRDSLDRLRLELSDRRQELA